MADRLKLYSAERMSWVVPDFRDDNDAGYRGFVDLEISDDLGRHFIHPRALFYGRLDAQKRIQEPATEPMMPAATGTRRSSSTQRHH